MTADIGFWGWMLYWWPVMLHRAGAPVLFGTFLLLCYLFYRREQ